jgi:hypothetical protein
MQEKKLNMKCTFEIESTRLVIKLSHNRYRFMFRLCLSLEEIYSCDINFRKLSILVIDDLIQSWIHQLYREENNEIQV